MGRSMIKIRSIRREFFLHFSSILIASLLSTLIIWGMAALLFIYFLNTNVFYPANHYEKQIPLITEYVQKHGELTLSSNGQEHLEEIIPLSGMSYSVLSASGEYLYGNLIEHSFGGQLPEQKEILSRLNLTHDGENDIIKYVPIVSNNGEMIGTLMLGYSLTVTSPNPKLAPLIKIGGAGVLLTPFIFIILFTLLFGRHFSRKISRPLQQLMDGAQRIKERELNFSISKSWSIKEVNQLTSAFEEMRSALEESLEREWKQEQERRTMFAALAHDLRTPLTIIQGHAEGLEESKELGNGEKFQQYLQIIKRNSQRASALLQDMNTIADLEKVTFRLRIIPVDIEEFVQEKALEYNSLCQEKEITFQCQIRDKRSSNKPILFDPYRIIQVLDNLVANSLRYTPTQGSINWNIELTDQFLTMEISDNGSGFQLHSLEHAFNPFYQGDSHSVRKKGHSGLGLYISKLLIQHHGGEIHAKNNPNGGAAVQFHIPV